MEFKENILIFADFVRKLYTSRYMLRMLTMKELRSSYVGSAFGFLWAVANPLLQVAIYGIVFGFFFRSTPDPRYGTDSYLIFLISGIVPWQFFAQSLGTSSGSLVSNLNLIKKAVGFPSEVLPIVTVASNLVGHFISLGILLALLVIFTGRFPVYLPVLLPYLFLTVVFTVGVGWILSSVNVFLRDIEQVLGLLTMGWFFFTPVLYSPGIVPPAVLPILKLNPMYHMVEGYRLALLTGQMLPWQDLAYFTFISFAALAVGGIVFRKLKPWFAEVL